MYSHLSSLSNLNKITLETVGYQEHDLRKICLLDMR